MGLQEDEALNKKSKIPPDSVKLQMAGDLLLARPAGSEQASLFRKYEALLEKYANMPRPERVLNYKFFVALVLTSHARRIQDAEARRSIFDLKNELYFNLANDRESRRKLGFRYLVSRNFRVIQFCSSCLKQNEESTLSRHQWKFCKKCKVDRKFYNVLSMHHRFDDGSATIFLSNDLITEVKNLKKVQKGKLDDFKEGAKLDRYHYNAKNLNIFELKSTIEIQKKIIRIR